MPEAKINELGNVWNLPHLRGELNLPIQIGEMTEKPEGKDGTKQSCPCWATNTIHCVVHCSLDVLDLAFGLVLMLAMSLGLSVINNALTQNVFLFAQFGLDIVALELNGSTNLANVIFKSLFNSFIRLHWVTVHGTTCQSMEDLQHDTTTASWDTIIHGRCVIEKCVSGHLFIEAWHVCTRTLRLETLAKRTMNDSTAVH